MKTLLLKDVLELVQAGFVVKNYDGHDNVHYLYSPDGERLLHEFLVDCVLMEEQTCKRPPDLTDFLDMYNLEQASDCTYKRYYDETVKTTLKGVTIELLEDDSEVHHYMECESTYSVYVGFTD